MQLLDFLTSLPAEEKDIFLDLLKETNSIELAVKGTMIVLADTEPELARCLEGPVNDWLKINQPLNHQVDSQEDSVVAHKKDHPGIVIFNPKENLSKA